MFLSWQTTTEVYTNEENEDVHSLVACCITQYQTYVTVISIHVVVLVYGFGEINIFLFITTCNSFKCESYNIPMFNVFELPCKLYNIVSLHLVTETLLQ